VTNRQIKIDQEIRKKGKDKIEKRRFEGASRGGK